jgi:hypothetical protein
MREEQKRRREEVERRYRVRGKGVEGSVLRVYQGVDYLVEGAVSQPVQLRYDEHPAYRRAFANDAAIQEWVQQGRLELRSYSSRLAYHPQHAYLQLTIWIESRKDLDEQFASLPVCTSPLSPP